MNLFILQLIGRMLTFIAVSIFSLVSAIFYEMTPFKLINSNNTKSVNVDISFIDYNTKKIYDSSIPTGETEVVTEGIEGIIYTYEGKEIKINDPVTRVLKVGTGAKGDYSGTLTAYGPDCYGCTGILACRTREGTYQNLYDGIYYTDEEFGQVRILAADHTLFPCGTVIEVTNSKLQKVIGIVLDTGSQMRKAWRQDGVVWVDLAMEKNDASALAYTNHNTDYQVKRWGW